MRVIHSTASGKKEGEGRGSFLLSDSEGGYLCLPNKDSNNSSYEGWLTYDETRETLYKTIENIFLGKVNTVHNRFSHVERDSGSATERFFLEKDVLMYEVYNHSGPVNIDLDFRHVHDFDTEGRTYEIYKKKGDLLLVKYVKYNGSEIGHEHYLAIKNVKEYAIESKWKYRDYEYDRRRNSKSQFYIYGSLKISCDKNLRLVFAKGTSEEEAIMKANVYWHFYHETIDRLERRSEEMLHHPDIETNCALSSLSSLFAVRDDREGIFAGFPWFFQFWARDEIIALKAFILNKDYFLAKDILMHYSERLDEGRFSNKDMESDLKSADAPGWLFQRMHELLSKLEKEGRVYDYFTREEMERVKHSLDTYLDWTEGLKYNDPLETWMDTSAGHDVRDGACIEVQALELRSYELGIMLSDLLGKEDIYSDRQNKLKKEVKTKFFDGSRLADRYSGEPDYTQRPNIFLAYYSFPRLLAKKEWESAFDYALDELWLEWGGLTSISKKNNLFVEEYTGQDNRSYHRGDSWYYVNNIAAICLGKVNSRKYKENIDKIKNASVSEMMFSGFLGHCAEVSSARTLRSEGCGCQAWSASTLFELLRH